MKTETYRIDEPCVVDVLVKDKYASISWSVGDGTDEIKVDLDKDETGILTFEFGDTSNIKYGGTDNWGRDLLPIYLKYTKDSHEGDSVYVDDITLQEYAGEGNWCRCYRLSNGAVMYQALSENESKSQRVAYFKHKTTDETIKRGFYKGRLAAKEWYVTIIQEGNPNGNEIAPKPEEPQNQFKIFKFDDWIDLFNKVISDNNKKTISKGANTYSYLEKMYNAAVDEFKNNSHGLFNEDIYKEIYEYRGNNNEFETKGISLNILTGWLLAMCLTEIMPTYGSITNLQTELFKIAYDACGGRDVSLYDDYTLKSDPIILRYVAGAIYAIMRNNYSFEYINSLRKELGVTFISASNWNELGYSSSDYKSIGNLGYVVNSDLIIPSAPGPYTNDSDPNRPKPWNEGQNEDQFYLGEYSDNWYKYNYKVDVAIDKFVTENYNLGSESHKNGNGWETYDKSKKLLMLQAATMPFATDHYFFGARRIKFDGVRYDNNYNYWRYYFVETSETPTSDNDVFDLAGPFAEFERKMFTSGYGITSNMKFFQNIMDMADNSRFPTYHTEYGRRRPLGGETPGTARAGEINGHPLNGILAGTIGGLFADDEAGYIKRIDCDDFPHDGPRTYPSGHAAMTWTVAMVLGQMDPDNITKYMTEAYKIGVGRTIGRFHWNSDTMYGRLFGTFILPIMNAMQGLQSSYEATKNNLFNNDEIVMGSDITINVNIINKSSDTYNVRGDMKLVLANPDINGNYYGWQGLYNRTDNIYFNKTPMTIESGKAYSFSGVYCPEISGRNLIDPNLLQQTSYKTNVLIYDSEGVSGIINPENISSSILFKDNMTLTLIIPGDVQVSGETEPVTNPGRIGDDISINIEFVNKTNRDINLYNSFRFVLANPDKEGTYHGWQGIYNRTDHIQFANSFVTIRSGETKRFNNIYCEDLGGRNLIDPNLLSQTSYKTNVLLYTTEGVSGVYNPENISPNIQFKNGETYQIIIK